PRAEAGFFALASFYENRGDLLKAKDAYQKIMEKFPASANIARAQEAVENLNVKMLFSPTIASDVIVYEVRKGDSLARIAKRFNATIDLIVKANNLKTTQINIGKKLRITKAKFSIFVDKSQNILTLKADGNIVKTYRVSTGQNNSTPVGTFKIVNKIIDPPWYTTGAVIPAGSPKNILGTRWMGISAPSYGIHGTTEPQSIGQSVTAGCVRMKNEDVEELYSIVPEGTEVVIVD
ncbi:MAG: L,D-transpeptidase family protein, partial [Candidatus Omnitrophica bacterium]|nr:L,D-transpeptidase family protein [Candidatus Omnitrophota bacterium]